MTSRNDSGRGWRGAAPARSSVGPAHGPAASLRTAALALAVVVLPGCYAWTEVPRPSAPVASGTQLRVTVTREEALRQAGESGGDVREVIPGRVVEDEAGRLGLTMRPARSPAEARLFRDYVEVPWSAVVRVEERRFSPLRTAALVAGAGVATVAILSVAEGESADEGGETPGPNEGLRIPLLRLRF